MPLDLEVLKKQQEAGLSNVIANQQGSLESNLAKTRSAVQGGRTNFFNSVGTPTSNILSLAGLSPTGSGANMARNRLETNLGANLSKRRATETNANIGLNLANQRRVVGDLTRVNQTANDNSRNFGALIKQQGFLAGQAQKDREQQMAMSNIQDIYANEGLNLDARSQAPDQYQAALNRAMFGLLGTGASMYAINKFGQKGGQDNWPTTLDTSVGNNAYGQPTYANANPNIPVTGGGTYE